ncbi:MAG: S8 family serine peptidase, partial [Desulfofustis sp.]|nr:S8 family serine peptidase [Desulfofustis sp.]
AKAIDIAITEDADIINLSLGSAQQDRLVSNLITRASQGGLQLVAPAGNNPQSLTMAFPASHPEVIAVAGFDEANNPLPNQTVAQRADAAAPSIGIFSTIPGNKHNFHDGTSFSAATISGLIALSLQNRPNSAPVPFPHFDKETPWQLQVTAFLGLP